MSVIDYKTFLPDDVLVKVDRASMAVSLEAREPLLDHKIIEYAAKIPVNIKYKNNTGKYLLKQILYKYIPKEMIERPKSGFQVPLIEWLRGDLKELLDSYVNESSLKTSGIYNTKEILKLKQKLYNGENINLSILWFVLMYEMWREKWGG
jgi:asparagine synthase (glutamine-hydrolysing)